MHAATEGRRATALAEALPYDQQAIARFAGDPIAWHNYAATLGDLGRAADAVKACEQAFTLGLDAPQTWSVYARAQQAAGDLDRAEYAYRQSLLRVGGDPTVAGELANLIWMRRGDVAQADAILDASFQAGGPPQPLLIATATLYEAAGDSARAAALLEAASQQLSGDTPILLTAAQAALRQGRVDDAARYVAMARAADPNSRGVAQHGAIVDLAQGRPADALAKLKAALATHPDDQSLWGWAATAARAAGDPLYAELCDYDAVVGAYDLATPQGWPSLEAFLSDLAKSLNKLHSYEQHPANQSPCVTAARPCTCLTGSRRSGDPRLFRPPSTLRSAST